MPAQGEVSPWNPSRKAVAVCPHCGQPPDVVDGAPQLPHRRDIPGFPGYQIRCDGTVWSRWNSRWGMLTTFVGPRPPGMEACHGDGNPLNNWLRNLRWDTPKNNHADMAAHGTTARGEAFPQAKLSDDAVRQIRALRAEGVYYRVIAARFGVNKRVIYHVMAGTLWKHVGAGAGP